MVVNLQKEIVAGKQEIAVLKCMYLPPKVQVTPLTSFSVML